MEVNDIDNKTSDEILFILNNEQKKMPLDDNHEKIMQLFDEFNSILNNEFDCYYTGGLMAYILNNAQLRRYHDDLDLFINEKQLLELKRKIEDNSDFIFVSYLNKKGVNGHEYKIKFRDYPVSIGLFLFERKKEGKIITKKYYYDLPNVERLFVDERHFNLKYTKMVFNDTIHTYNNKKYKSVSLEFLYYSKSHLYPFRLKDYYDLLYVRDIVDHCIVENIDSEKSKKMDILHKEVNESIILDLENELVDKKTVVLRKKRGVQ